MESRNPKNLSRAQEKAKLFIEEHKVEKVISEMLNSLVHARDPNPIIFMVRALLTNNPVDKILGQPGDRARA